MERCKVCGLQNEKFNVKLTKDNVCNYCKYYDKHKDKITNYSNKEKIMIDRFENLRGKYKYDAIVGLSGGKDSTYVLYEMIHKYKLNVLALTYDNGFLSEYAKKSIEKTVKNLEVNHIYYKPDINIHRKFYIAAVNKLGDPCLACAFGGYFLAIKISHEMNVPFFVHGRSPFQMYRNFYENSKDIFLPMMELNLKEHSFKNLSKVYNELHSIIRNFICSLFDNVITANEVIQEFILDSSKLTSDFTPELLAYFLYVPYDEKAIKKKIMEEINWIKPENDNLLGHYDCKLHDAAGYFFKEINNVDVLEPDIAVIRRFGLINEEKANKIIKANKLKPSNIDDSINELCRFCNFNKSDLLEKINVMKKNNTTKFESR